MSLVFFDCTCVVARGYQMTGIPRTVNRLAIEFQKNTDVKLLAFNSATCTFNSVDCELDSFNVAASVTFKPGDIFVTAEPTWVYETYNDAMAQLRNSGVFIYQVFYDLIPALFPYYYEDGIGFGSYYKEWLRRAFELCDGAFSISAQTKSDMIRVFGLDSNRSSDIKVVRLGDDICSASIESARDDSIVPLEPYILCVGTLELRKNQLILLNAYRHIVSASMFEPPRLLILGNDGWNDGGLVFQVEADPILNKRVEVLRGVSDDQLTSLYKNCLFTVYPSYYEGWGLPVSESLLHGKVSVCSSTSSMREIAPNITVFASPYSLGDWIAAISLLTNDEDYRRSLEYKIASEHNGVSWSHTTEQILGFIKERHG